MKGRRFAAVLIVLSMILMLVPLQAFAGDKEDTVSETEQVTAASDTLNIDGVMEEGVGDQELLIEDTANTEAVSGSGEITAEEVTEDSVKIDEPAEPDAEVTEEEDAASEAETEADLIETAGAEETEEKDAALDDETAGDADVTQMTFSGTSSEVAWHDATSAVDENGSRTVTFNAVIPDGTTASELNLNILDTPNLNTISFTPAPAETIKYIVNITDAAGAYRFKEGSGAVAIADGSWNVSASVSASLAKAMLLSADGASGGYSSADTYLTASGEGNGFNSVLQSQWSDGQTSQSLSYYQQMQSGDSTTAYPAVQFKLVPAEAAESAADTVEDSEETLSGSVPLSVKKVLTGQTLKAEQFTFELKDENGNVLQTKKNAQDGTIPFDSIQFTGDDLGEHKYTVNEVVPEGAKADANGKIIVDNIEYDTHTENVTITISLNDEGKLKATVRQSTTELTFTNKYVGTGAASTSTSRTSPRTGDSVPIMPYFSMLAGAGIALIMSRRLIRAYIRH
ncbi:MAG: hypothetical protein IJI10_10980 [Eubacterium sp.]|nr:hypothetical protein [Eubacterium sp.]